MKAVYHRGRVCYYDDGKGDDNLPQPAPSNETSSTQSAEPSLGQRLRETFEVKQGGS